MYAWDIIPFLKIYIALSVLMKYETPFIFAIVAFESVRKTGVKHRLQGVGLMRYGERAGKPRCPDYGGNVLGARGRTRVGLRYRIDGNMSVAPLSRCWRIR